MARAALPVQSVIRSGLAPAYTAFGADGHSVRNSGREFIFVKNAGLYPKTITIQTPQTVDGQLVAERTVEIDGPDGEIMIGPFLPLNLYTQTDGAVYIDIVDEADVTIAALRLG